MLTYLFIPYTLLGHVCCMKNNESCQEFRGQSVLEIETVHNLRKVRMYLNVLSLRSTC